MNEQTRIQKTVVAANNFYASSASMMFFLSITSAFGVLQIILFLTGNLKLNGQAYDPNGGNIVAWIALAVAMVSAFTGFISGIYSMRGNTIFIYWSSVQYVAAITVVYFAGMILTGVALLMQWIITLARYFVWKFNMLDKYDINMDHLFIGILILVFALVVFFTIMVSQFEALYTIKGHGVDELGNEVADFVKPQWQGYFDGFSAALTISASILIMFKHRMAFVLYFIAKIFLFVNYAATGNVVPIVQLLLFSTMDITAFLAWSMHLVEPEDTVIEE